MRNDKVAVPNVPGTELHDIEIEGPGAPTFGSLPSLGALNGLTRLEQGVGVETSLEQHHLVQVWRLFLAAEGCGFLDGRGCEQAGLWEGSESIAGGLEVGRAIAQIAS